jgi:hypothetical protein
MSYDSTMSTLFLDAGHTKMAAQTLESTRAAGVGSTSASVLI